MKTEWRDGNRLRLLANGEQYFPRVFEAIRRAKESVLLETFIFSKMRLANRYRKLSWMRLHAE